MESITWNEFEKVELRVGRIISAKDFTAARRPSYLLSIDFGTDIGIRKSSAQITDHYASKDLVGRLIVGVVNFPKKQIGPIMSEVLVTGFYDEAGKVILCCPDMDVPLGSKLG